MLVEKLKSDEDGLRLVRRISAALASDEYLNAVKTVVEMKASAKARK